jgi:hypothetical protein
MKTSYKDLTSRLGEPLWWDECGVPRYDPFHPGDVSSIYAREVALVEVGCQACDALMKVAVTTGFIGFPDELAEQIADHRWAYGDPPSHRCSGAGETMNSEPKRICEFWHRKGVGPWTRQPAMEKELE